MYQNYPPPPVLPQRNVLPPPVPTRRSNSLAIAALICAVVSPFMVVTAPLAIVFGYKARRQLAVNPAETGAGMATAGIIVGWIFTVLFALVFLGSLAAAAGGR